VGAELFRADGRTDRYDKANNRFSRFCERAQQRVMTGLRSSLGCSYLQPSVTFQYFPQHHARGDPLSVFFA
jgi:hypothetical protein